MGKIIEGISGIRGYGPNFFRRTELLVRAFSSLYPKTVVFGRDTREGEKRVLDIARKAYLETGSDFIDIGIAPTPTIQLIARKFNCNGNSATASHNPDPWLGLKFFSSSGMINAQSLENMQTAIIENRFKYKKAEEISIDSLLADSPSRNGQKALDYHIKCVLESIGGGAVEKIRQRKFRVVVDHVMGAGHSIIPKMLDYLGCQVINVYDGKPNGRFPRKFPEPTPDNLGEFKEILKFSGSDIGFAVDPDSDRLLLGSKEGCLSEEYTLAIAIKYFMEKVRGKHNVVANLSTSRMGEDIALANGWNFIRTPIGERHVLDGMIESGAIIGGEGNGGIINPALTPGRDAVYGIALILAYMAEYNLRLKDFVKEMPRYHIIKKTLKNVSHEKYEHGKTRLMAEYPGTKVDLGDGVRIDMDEGWLHVRNSNTEPIVRVIAEAKKPKFLERLVESARVSFRN